MTAQEIRRAYIEFFKDRGHHPIARARLVPENDPSTLFTGSGMKLFGERFLITWA